MGFIDFDYTLKRINPSDIDYGKRLDERRRLVLEETVEAASRWISGMKGRDSGALFVPHSLAEAVRSSSFQASSRMQLHSSPLLCAV
jgi:hypothetical protein